MQTGPIPYSRAVASGVGFEDYRWSWVRALFPRRPSANQYPGRGYPQEHGSVMGPAVGGAHGPSAIPSRLADPGATLPAPPAAAGGAWGPSARTRREPALVMPGRSPTVQQHQFDNELLHSTIRWSRPRYENEAGRDEYMPPTQQPSWTYDSALQALVPLAPIPVQQKSINPHTVSKSFGDTSTGQLSRASYGKVPGVPVRLKWYGQPGSPTYPTPSWMVRRPQSGSVQRNRRWSRQAKWQPPLVSNLTRWGQAGSYGQTTKTLPTAPVNQPAGSGQGATY